MIGKMNEFMRQLGDKMSDWFGSCLSKFTDAWWNDMVNDNLSQLQRNHVDQKQIKEYANYRVLLKKKLLLNKPQELL